MISSQSKLIGRFAAVAIIAVGLLGSSVALADPLPLGDYQMDLKLSGPTTPTISFDGTNFQSPYPGTGSQPVDGTMSLTLSYVPPTGGLPVTRTYNHVAFVIDTGFQLSNLYAVAPTGTTTIGPTDIFQLAGKISSAAPGQRDNKFYLADTSSPSGTPTKLFSGSFNEGIFSGTLGDSALTIGSSDSSGNPANLSMTAEPALLSDLHLNSLPQENEIVQVLGGKLTVTFNVNDPANLTVDAVTDDTHLVIDTGVNAYIPAKLSAFSPSSTSVTIGALLSVPEPTTALCWGALVFMGLATSRRRRAQR